MTDNFPRLCGGTFFTLLLEAVRQRSSKRDVYKTGGDGLSHPEVFRELVRIVNPDYIEPQKKDTLKNQALDYRKCKISSGAYLPFKDNATLHTFDERVKKNYDDVLRQMKEFSDSFLSTKTKMHKDVDLVKALLDLISQDESISDSDCFYALSTGNPICKKDLVISQTICFESFLLGVWHFSVENRRDNSVGEDTFNEWCPQTGKKNERLYSGHIGEEFHDVTLTYFTEINTSSEENKQSEEETMDGATVIDGESKSNQTTKSNVTVQILGKVGNVFNGPINGDLHITNYLGDDDERET
jgi:hypothetical protein